jgi:hypothetical protein
MREEWRFSWGEMREVLRRGSSANVEQTRIPQDEGWYFVSSEVKWTSIAQ